MAYQHKLSTPPQRGRFITVFSLGIFTAAIHYHDVPMMGFSAIAVVLGFIVWMT